MKKLYILISAAVLSTGMLSAQQYNVPTGAEQAPDINGNNQNPTPQTPWQVLFSYDITTAGAGTGNAGVVVFGTDVWVSKWASDTISVFSALTGSLSSQFTVPGVTGIRSMTTDGSFIYAGANTSDIYKINPSSHTLAATIATSVPNIRYCTYDASLPGFWVGTWATDFQQVDMSGNVASGAVIASSHALTATYGLAYDGTSPGGPYLWAFHQTGSSNAADLIQVNIASGVQTGIVHDVTGDMGTAGDLAGGCHIVTTPTLALVGVLQGATNMLFSYDIIGVNGMNEPAADAAFVSAYPNPSNDMVNIQVKRENNEPMTIQMVDVTGRVVFESNTVGMNNYINISSYAAGVYTVKVMSNDQVYTTELIKN